MDTTEVTKKIKFSMTKKARRILIIVVAALVLVGGGGFAYYKLSYLPSHTKTVQKLQTAVVKSGDLTITASGTGTLTSASTASFGFKTSGQITAINVVVGSVVKKGDLLAALDNTSAQLTLTQAKRSLADMTSANAIATAQQAVADAETSVSSTRNTLAYEISPSVYLYETKVADAQAALNAAQTTYTNSATDENKKTLDKAQTNLKYYQGLLSGAKIHYTNVYIKANFTVEEFDQQTHKRTKYVAPPSDAEIQTARANYAAAQATLAEAKNYLTLITGGEIPDDATGTNLTTYENAQLTVKNAEAALANTNLYAPIDGTVMSISANLGDSVSASTALMEIADLNQPYFDAYFDSTDWDKIKTGYEAQITFDNLSTKIFKGEVVSVDPGLTTSGNSSMVTATIKLDDSTYSSDLQPLGASAGIDVVAASAKNAPLVPVEALHLIDGSQYGVFVQENGKLTVKIVEIGIKDTFNAEVKSGLKVGDVVSTGTVTTTSSSSTVTSSKGTN
jgi:RND family efflux transporter MFP subunit